MKWKVPLYRIYHDEEDKKAVDKVIERGTYWTNGPEVSEFEKELSTYLNSKYVLAFNNGTSALHAMLLAYGIGPGDEIIVPSFTFISTANSVLFTGARPVFADIENKTFAIDPESVREKITEKTKAIMPMHYGGTTAEKIKELKELADEKEILLLEDAAESLGSNLNGKKAGTFGNSAIFSFCANKVITTGEGGAVVTDSKEAYEKLKLLRSHGRAENENYFDSAKHMDYVSLGFNFRMSSITAALAVSQLKKLGEIISMRREAAKMYDESLRNLVSIPPNDTSFNVYQMYTIMLESPEKRNMLKKHLEENGIMSKIYFHPVHTTHFYNTLGYDDKLPETEQVSESVLSIPIFAGMSSEEITYVCSKIREFVK